MTKRNKRLVLIIDPYRSGVDAVDRARAVPAIGRDETGRNASHSSKVVAVLQISDAAAPRSLGEGDAESLGHAVQRAPVDAENLRGAGSIPAGGVKHMYEVATFEIVERRKIGKRLVL